MRKFILDRLYNTLSNLSGRLFSMKSSDLNPTVLLVMMAVSTDSALKLLKILDSNPIWVIEQKVLDYTGKNAN